MPKVRWPVIYYVLSGTLNPAHLLILLLYGNYYLQCYKLWCNICSSLFVCLSVCHIFIVSKWLNILLHFFSLPASPAILTFSCQTSLWKSHGMILISTERWGVNHSDASPLCVADVTSTWNPMPSPAVVCGHPHCVMAHLLQCSQSSLQMYSDADSAVNK